MNDKTARKSGPAKNNQVKIAELLGNMYAHTTSLKLFHWLVTGHGSYAAHMATELAIKDMERILDRLAETCIALYGDLPITIPETEKPEDLIGHCEAFYDEVEKARDLFGEDFTDSILDDWQEAQQQLLYRLKRLQ